MKPWTAQFSECLVKPVIIIGGGPSLRGYDWSPILKQQAQGRLYVIGTNDAYRLGFPNLVLFGDSDWFFLPNRGDGWGHREALEVYARQGGMVVSCSCPSAAEIEEFKKCPFVHHIQRGPLSGLSVNPRSLAWNGNTGAAAINLALLLGATSVILLGFDCKADKNGKGNWHENVKQPVPPPHIYERFTKFFNALASELPRYFPGVPVLNAGPDSALGSFPMIDLGKDLSAWL
jgi:hypothetical protein